MATATTLHPLIITFTLIRTLIAPLFLILKTEAATTLQPLYFLYIINDNERFFFFVYIRLWLVFD